MQTAQLKSKQEKHLGRSRRPSPAARSIHGAGLSPAPAIDARLEESINRYLAEHAFRCRDLRDHFDCIDGDVPHIDAILMRPLREALSAINYPLTAALFQRGLLPHALESALSMTQFLALCLPAARGAQMDSADLLPRPQCVPASVLVSEGELISGPACFEKLEIERNDVFRVGLDFPTLYASFAERARTLSGDPRFKKVLLAAENAEQYLKELAVCEIWTPQQRADIIDRILRYDLLQCDCRASFLE